MKVAQQASKFFCFFQQDYYFKHRNNLTCRPFRDCLEKSFIVHILKTFLNDKKSLHFYHIFLHLGYAIVLVYLSHVLVKYIAEYFLLLN